MFYIKSSSQTQGKEIVFHIIYLFKKKKKKPNLPGWDSNCEPSTLWKTVEPIGLWQLVYKLCKIYILIYIAFASVVCLKLDIEWKINLFGRILTAANRHKQNSWFCKEIREDNFRFWWRRVHEDASQGMYVSKIEIFFFTARILQNQRMLCCGECFHD